MWFRKQIAICSDCLLASKTDMAMKATRKSRKVGASGTDANEISDLSREAGWVLCDPSLPIFWYMCDDDHHECPRMMNLTITRSAISSSS